MTKSKINPTSDEWRDVRAAFSIRFGSQRAATGEWIPKVKVRNRQTGEALELVQQDRHDWAGWILEQFVAPNARGTESKGDSRMVTEVVERTVPKKKRIAERLKARYEGDLSAEHKVEHELETSGERVIVGAETPESAGLGPHARVSSGEAGGALTRTEGSEYGSLGPPSNGSGLEVEPSGVAATARTESATAISSEDEVNEALLLDAWYAQNSPTLALTAMRYIQADDDARETLEVVIGDDDRIRITDGLTENFPWRSICSLRIEAADGSMWVGTGWLVGPRTVITAGHCVYIHNRGGWARHIDVMPGRDGSTQPFSAQRATSFHSVAGWTQDEQRAYDYGAIILPAHSAIGNEHGWFGFGVYDDATLEGTIVNLSGYPAEKSPVGSQWFHSLPVGRVTPTTIEYLLDTTGGQSGSPVWWLMSNGDRIAVGIHTNGAFTGNSATRITEDVFDNIVAWKELNA